MPRDGSGFYSLPASNPVIDGTLIDVNWANPTLSDIAAQLNNVYTRDGVLGPTGPFRFVDGSVSTPGLAFTNEVTMGWYRPIANQTSFAVAGAQVQTMDARTSANVLFRIWPRTAGISSIMIGAFPSGDANLSNLTLSATPTGGGIASFGSTGDPSLRVLNFFGTSFGFTSAGGVISNLTSGGSWIIPNGGTYGFNGSGSLFNQFGLQLATFQTLGDGTKYTDAITAFPSGHTAKLIMSGAPTGLTQVQAQADGASFGFTNNVDAIKNGGASTWVITSDRRLKQDIYDYKVGLSHVLAIRPRTYCYKSHVNMMRVGIIADELSDIFPEAIGCGEDGYDNFTMDPVIWALVNATKELHGRIADLEAQA